MNAESRKSGAERREEIVLAALRVIGDAGFAAMSTSRLASEVGVTSGALFRHFDSREAILREVARTAVARMEATFPEADAPPLDRLLSLARARIRVLGADRGLSWVLRSEEAPLALPPDAVEWLQDLVARSRRFLLTALRDAVADGTVRRDIDPELLLVPVMGTIHSLIGMAGVHRGPTAAISQKSDRVLDALLTLLAPPPKQKSR